MRSLFWLALAGSCFSPRLRCLFFLLFARSLSVPVLVEFLVRASRFFAPNPCVWNILFDRRKPQKKNSSLNTFLLRNAVATFTLYTQWMHNKTKPESGLYGRRYGAFLNFMLNSDGRWLDCSWLYTCTEREWWPHAFFGFHNAMRCLQHKHRRKIPFRNQKC